MLFRCWAWVCCRVASVFAVFAWGIAWGWRDLLRWERYLHPLPSPPLKVYVVSGGYSSWVSAKLKTKLSSVVSGVELVLPGTGIFGKGGTQQQQQQQPPRRLASGTASRRALPPPSS
jgi:hypothetical protein